MEWTLACYIYSPVLLKGLQKSTTLGGGWWYTPALLVCRVHMGLGAIREKGVGAGRAGGQKKTYYRQSRLHCGWTRGLLHRGSNDQIWVSKPGLQKEKCEIFIFFHEVFTILKDPVFLVTPLGMVDVGSSQPEICGSGEEGEGGGAGVGWGRQGLRERRNRIGVCTFHTQLLPGLTFSPRENKGPIYVA